MDYEEEMNQFFVKGTVPTEAETSIYLDMLRKVTTYEILLYLKGKKNLPEIKSINIPQFSNIDDLDGVLDIVFSTENICFEDIGYYFYPDSKQTAQWKYGENHYKTAALLGLTSWEKPYQVTDFGRAYMMISKAEKNGIRNKMVLRVPIIQKVLLTAMESELKPMDILTQYLAYSTARRRHSNVHVMVDLVVSSLNPKERTLIVDNLKWK